MKCIVCDCYQDSHPGKDSSLVPGDQQQVSQILSSSHLSADTDDSNLMDATDIGERAQPDKHRIRDAWYDMFFTNVRQACVFLPGEILECYEIIVYFKVYI